MLLLIVLIILVVVFFGARGRYGTSPYYDGGFGVVGLLLVILLILYLLGYVHV